jgi:hypothetical protein
MKNKVSAADVLKTGQQQRIIKEYPKEKKNIPISQNSCLEILLHYYHPFCFRHSSALLCRWSSVKNIEW